MNAMQVPYSRFSMALQGTLMISLKVRQNVLNRRILLTRDKATMELVDKVMRNDVAV